MRGQSRRLYSELIDGIDSIPGVVGSALTSVAPLGRPTSLVTVRPAQDRKGGPRLCIRGRRGRRVGALLRGRGGGP